MSWGQFVPTWVQRCSSWATQALWKQRSCSGDVLLWSVWLHSVKSKRSDAAAHPHHQQLHSLGSRCFCWEKEKQGTRNEQSSSFSCCPAREEPKIQAGWEQSMIQLDGNSLWFCDPGWVGRGVHDPGWMGTVQDPGWVGTVCDSVIQAGRSCRLGSAFDEGTVL